MYKAQERPQFGWSNEIHFFFQNSNQYTEGVNNERTYDKPTKPMIYGEELVA